jgi:hypothetical protein
MSYTETFTLIIQPDLIDVGRAITRALDPDVGGAESWTPLPADPANPDSEITGYTVSTPCVPEFKAQAEAMLAAPALLHGAVSADYAARWPDLTPPTLEECEAFCAGAVVPAPEPAAAPEVLP